MGATESDKKAGATGVSNDVADARTLLRALVVRPHWAERILKGHKTWEIRNAPVDRKHWQQRIAISASKTNAIQGSVKFVACRKLMLEEFARAANVSK